MDRFLSKNDIQEEYDELLKSKQVIIDKIGELKKSVWGGKYSASIISELFDIVGI